MPGDAKFLGISMSFRIVTDGTLWASIKLQEYLWKPTCKYEVEKPITKMWYTPIFHILYAD